MIAFHAVLAQQNAQLALSLRVTTSTQSMLILASSVEHVKVFALLALHHKHNYIN
jgi:hypothetical protein